ncbi:unnamed protein product [Paramecium sonneborni]|uniref:RBR-type E3 ubiquitin transferase n=1 Tax=Paramecium sonneborni TaxID=65129 RepID=A0A8S1NWS7_9CILI|nr:unnamed protein product [Paramecium sonneborni]
MLEIIDLVNQIKQQLGNRNDDDLIIQSFILGLLQGKANPYSQEYLQENLETLMNLNMLIDINIYKPQRVQKLFNDILQGSKTLQQLSTLLEAEVFNEIEEIQDNQQNQDNQNQINQQFIIKQQNLNQDQENYKKVQQNSVKFQLFKQNQQQEQQQQKQINSKNKKILKEEKNAQKIQLQLNQNSLNESNSLKLAHQLQQQFDEEDNLMKQFEIEQHFEEYQAVQIEKKNQVECKICLEYIPFIELATLYCSHMYHQKCLAQYCLTQMESRQFPILCPSECKKNIIYSDLIEVLDDKQILQFQKLTFKAYIDTHNNEYSWCPTPDCQYVFVLGEQSQFECPVCQKRYCLECKIEYHNGFSCQEYQKKIKMENQKALDDKFFSFIKGAKYKQCPQCKFWVEKSEGCNHMTCRCKFEFCYVCGGVYEKCECVIQAHANWPRTLRRNRR